MNIELRLDAYAGGPKRLTDGPTAHVKNAGQSFFCVIHTD